MTRAKLLADIEAFLARHDMYQTDFGVRAVNDRRCVGRLREGFDITLGKAERIYLFMAAYEAEQRSKKRTRINRLAA